MAKPVKPQSDHTVESPYATTLGHAAPPFTSEDTLPLTEVPRHFYEVEAEQGRGGIGVVLRAKDRRLGRRVALKQLQDVNASSQERFEREMRFIARLQHPGIVPIHEAGCWDTGMPFYSMRLIEGRSLREHIEAANSLDERLILLPNLLTVAETIAYAHSQGIIHRDLKPGNVIVGAYGETMVIDWGLAKAVGEADADAACGSYESVPELTVAGQVMGTPSFMPPEQARGEPVDQRADVWALGAVLYNLVCGVAPYVGRTSNDVLQSVLAGPPRPVLEVMPDAPPELVAIIVRAMAHDATQRYANAVELAQDLRRFQNGQLVGAHRYTLAALLLRWLRKHRGIVAVAGLSLVSLGVIGVVSMRNVLGSRAAALRARSTAESRTRDLLLAQASAVLEHDPTMTMAWLRDYLDAGGDPRPARTLAGNAWSKGIARYVAHADSGVLSAPHFLADGDRVTIISRRSVGVFNLRTHEMRTIGELGAMITAERWANKRVLATCDAAGALNVWDVEAETHLLLSTDMCKSHITQPHFVLDERAVLVVDTAGRLHALAVDGSGELPIPEVTDVAWYVPALDGKHLVCGRGRDGTEVEFLRLDTGARTRVTLPPDGEFIPSDDGESYAAAWEDGTIRIFDADGHTLSVLRGPLDSHLDFSRDKQRLVAAGEDGRIHVWNFATGSDQEIWKQQGAYGSPFFLPDGRLLVWNVDGEATLFDVENGDRRAISAGGKKSQGYGISVGGRYVAPYDAGGDFRIYDLNDGPPVILHPVVFNQPSAITVSPNGRSAAIIGDGGRVLVVDVGSGMRRVIGACDPGVLVKLAMPTNPGPHMIYSPDSKALAVSDRAGSIHVFDLDRGTATTLAGHPGGTYGLAFVRDAHTIASAGQDATVRLWNVDDGSYRVLRQHGQPIRSLALSPSGRWLATGDKAGTIELFDVQEERLNRTLRGDAQMVMALAFSSDENLLASGDYNGQVRLWHTKSGSSRLFTGNKGFVDTLAFSPDGNMLASAGSDSDIHLWDLRTDTSRILRGHGAWIRALEFSPDGERLLSAGAQDRTARLWDLTTGENRPIEHRGGVTYAHFLPDGRHIISGGTELRYWSDDLPWDRAGLRTWIDAHTDLHAPQLGMR
jgi:eukaryotic-like serine/threonine-protein kinase